MYNCINIAFDYLKDKYGYTRRGYTSSFSNKLIKARNKKEREEIENNSTDKDYFLKINPITDEKDEVIQLLISQYYYGIQAKKELYYKLMEFGIID